MNRLWSGSNRRLANHFCALVLALLMNGNDTSLARIGETRAECARRYGAPVSVKAEENINSFEANDMSVTCTFDSGNDNARCELIQYSSLKGMLTNPVSIEQAETLLQANSQGMKWSRPTQERTGLGIIIRWQRDDGAIARLVLGSFNIEAPSKIKRDEDARRKKEGESLKGF